MKPMAVIAVLAALVASAPSRAEEPSLGRLWADFGLGYGNLHSSSTPDTGGGLWLDAQIGGRINSQWLAGLNIGGLGMQPASSNYNSDNPDIYGQGITNVFVVFQFEPKSDHGWFVGGGAGEVIYANKRLADETGNTRSGSGHGAIARIGYDWRSSNRGHLEATMGYELGNVGLYAPVGGNFRFSIIAASIHVAYH